MLKHSDILEPKQNRQITMQLYSPTESENLSGNETKHNAG